MRRPRYPKDPILSMILRARRFSSALQFFDKARSCRIFVGLAGDPMDDEANYLDGAAVGAVDAAAAGGLGATARSSASARAC